MRYPDLKEIELRPRQYWNADGLPDLAVGVLWIIWGTAFNLPELLPPGKWLFYYWMAVSAILIASGVAANWATKKLKQRLTFPRTGYVEWAEPRVAMKILPAILAAGVAAGMVGLIQHGKTQTMREMAAPAFALLFALAFLFAAIWHKLPHYLWLSGASLVLAAAIAMTHLSPGHGIGCVFLALGALSILMGCARLRTYLRINPPPQEGES